MTRHALEGGAPSSPLIFLRIASTSAVPILAIGPNGDLALARPITVKVKRLANGHGLALPVKMTEHAAGFDLHAAVQTPLTLGPGGIQVVPCGFAMALPPGYEAQVRPRSGLAS